MTVDVSRALKERGIRLRCYQPGEHRAPVLSATAGRMTTRRRVGSTRTAQRRGCTTGADGKAGSGQRARNARAKPGERLEYYRGLLAIDRINGTSPLREAERLKLAAVADRAFALVGRGKLHLLQERHGDGNYSYWAVARAPARSIDQVPSRFSIDQRSERPRL